MMISLNHLYHYVFFLIHLLIFKVIGDDFGQECKERSLSNHESPVQLMMLWPKHRPEHTSYRFYLREKVVDYSWRVRFVMDPQLIKDYFHRCVFFFAFMGIKRVYLIDHKFYRT